MEAETQQTRDLGCWNVPAVEADWYSILDPGHPTPNWVVPDKASTTLPIPAAANTILILRI